MIADGDPIPNSDTPLTSSEESALSPGNPALREPVFGEADQSSSKRFPLNESDEASRAETKTESRSCGSLSPVYPHSCGGSRGNLSRAETKEDSPFKDEIDSMRRALKRLVELFSKVESLRVR
jgi:hypothetical protein